jgi:YHS domain-containing protein
MKKMMTIIILSIVGIIGIAVAVMAYNKVLPIGFGMHKPVYQVDNIALNGYDVTTYFNENLKKGSSEFSTNNLGVDWHFSSKENLNLFMEDPERYLPQFGGYCSKAVSTGFAAPADPSIYTVYEGKLYIFSSEDVKESFGDNPSSLITACEKKWK